MPELLSHIFKKNRAEELPNDLWENFVLPINYEQYNLLKETKGVKVVGGRGTGKTMYLKYHAFFTQFSQKRTNIDKSALHTIGIYWKPDTHFVQLMNENYLGKQWHSAFNTYIALSLILQFSEFIKVFVESKYNDTELKKNLKTFSLPQILSEELKGKDLILCELSIHIKGLLYKLQNWLHNPTSELPIILDTKGTLEYLIASLREEHLLKDTSFHIFIDEFENLREEHQNIINTWMKHGENPLLFSVAYKKHAKVSDSTTGIENTQRRNDHRIIDLVDDIYAKTSKDFKILSAEIIANKIQKFSNNLQIIDTKNISNQSMLSERRTEDYKKNILHLAMEVFPQLNYEEIAEKILLDTTLQQRILKNITQALKERSIKLQAHSFIHVKYPKASLVNSILLNRTKINPEALKNTFEQYIKNINNKSTLAYREQIANNLVGAILYLYSSFPKRICPIYSGFDRFCIMSKNNLRHLLELCYQSFVELENNTQNLTLLKNKLPIVNIEQQLKAAKFCSKQELDTISELGPYGQDLQKIANRLGKIFYLKQRIKTQSQPENIHFSVETISLNSIDAKINTLLYQAILWNVLQEYDETTKETEDSLATKEFMLTPILAPYYKITMRKKHKIVFSITDFKTIFLEGDKEFDRLYNRLIKDWKINESIDNGLFESLY